MPRSIGFHYFFIFPGFAATLAGISLQDYLTKSEVLASSQLAATKLFHNDLLFSSLDYCVEAEPLGAEILFPPNAYPHIKSPLLDDWHRVLQMSIPDPYTAGRMPLVLEACQMLLEKDAGEHFVMGQVMGPTTIASQIFGIENLIYLLIDEPEGLTRLLSFTAQVTQTFAEALFTVGAHGVMINEPSASPNIFPKEVFQAFIHPVLKATFAELKRKYSGAIWLQIAGNSTTILPSIAELEMDLVTIDFPVNLSQALQALSHKTVCGNLNPLLFLKGKQDQMAEALGGVIKQGRKAGYILGTGCEIPLDSDPQNLEHLIRLLRCK